VRGVWPVPTSSFGFWGYGGADGFAAADARYYASEERKRMSPDPARYIEAPINRMMTSVLPS
jgi:hypothetical protein